MVDGEEIQRGAKMDPFSKHHHSKQYEFKSHCICDLLATGTRLERRLAHPLLFLCFLTRGGAVSSFPLCDISRLASAFLVLSSRKSMTFFKTFHFIAEGYQAAKRSVWLIWRNCCWINQTAGPFTLIFSHFYLAEQRQTCRAGLLFVICVLKGARACAFSTCEVQRCTVLKTVASSTGCLLLNRLYADEERGDYLQRLFGLSLKKMCLSSCFAKEMKTEYFRFPFKHLKDISITFRNISGNLPEAGWFLRSVVPFSAGCGNPLLQDCFFFLKYVLQLFLWIHFCSSAFQWLQRSRSSLSALSYVLFRNSLVRLKALERDDHFFCLLQFVLNILKLPLCMWHGEKTFLYHTWWGVFSN